MIDTDNVKGGYCSKQEMIFYLKAVEEVKRLNRFAHCAMNFMSKHDLHFQFLNEHGVFTAPDGGSISMFIPYSYKWDDETKVSSESIQFTVRGEEE